MQVTSSHVSIWFDFLASYDEYTAVVKFGNVTSEHVKSAISVVQPQLSAAQQKPSAVQQNRVGALVTHHPAWMSHHTGGSRQGHPRYTGAQQWEGRGWPDQEISQSAAHRYTKCKSCLTESAISVLCCAQNFQLDQLPQNNGEEDARTKRRRQDCAKSKPTAMIFTSIVSTSSSSVHHPICVEKPGDTQSIYRET